MPYAPELPSSSVDRAPAIDTDSETYARTAVQPVPSVAEEETEPPVEELQSRPVPVPVRTIPLLALLLAIGAIVLVFTMLTVHRRKPAELLAHGMAQRIHFATTYWLDHGFFQTGGVPVRKGPGDTVVFHRSSTGGRLLGGFIIQKAYASITGRYSWRLMALYNQLVVLFIAALLALLAFRLAVRAGIGPLHALVLAVSLEAVFFTFPDNLALYWGTSGREYWLLFAVIFLLAEERCAEGRTRRLTIVQGVCAFLLTYMEYIAGLGFVVSYGLATLILDGDRATLKRIAFTCFIPALLAIGLHRGQLAHVGARFPNIERQGSEFLFRTGLDGSAQYYDSHLDIAYRRDWARGSFPTKHQLLFRWKWLFFAGIAALSGVLLSALRGKVPRSGIVVLLALAGSYVLTAAVFSQAVVIHPYLYDVMLLTPLIVALFVLGPALVESITQHRGIAVIAVFFLAVWVSMVQVRRYALQYPQPPPKATAQ